MSCTSRTQVPQLRKSSCTAGWRWSIWKSSENIIALRQCGQGTCSHLHRASNHSFQAHHRPDWTNPYVQALWCGKFFFPLFYDPSLLLIIENEQLLAWISIMVTLTQYLWSVPASIWVCCTMRNVVILIQLHPVTVTIKCNRTFSPRPAKSKAVHACKICLWKKADGLQWHNEPQSLSLGRHLWAGLVRQRGQLWNARVCRLQSYASIAS